MHSFTESFTESFTNLPAGNSLGEWNGMEWNGMEYYISPSRVVEICRDQIQIVEYSTTRANVRRATSPRRPSLGLGAPR